MSKTQRLQDIFGARTQDTSTQSVKQKLKLPKFDIMTFNGNKLQWVEFWDSFEIMHKNDKLSPIERYNYLKGRLAGEARNTIFGLSYQMKTIMLQLEY